MIVSEFIEWLKTQDQGAIVEVIVQLEPEPYQSFGECEIQDFDSEKDTHFDYSDMRGNPHVKSDSCLFNKRFLTIGSKT